MVYFVCHFFLDKNLFLEGETHEFRIKWLFLPLLFSEDKLLPQNTREIKKKNNKLKHNINTLTSSVTMIRGYLSSDRKLKMHQILKESSLEMSS